MNAGVRYDRYKGWLPEQDQMAGTEAGWASSFPTLASQVQAKSFAQRDLYTWNSFAPRIGVVYDLSGTGRTVVKAQLRPLLAQPGCRHQRQRQPEHRQQVGDLHLDGPERRPPLAAG